MKKRMIIVIDENSNIREALVHLFVEAIGRGWDVVYLCPGVEFAATCAEVGKAVFQAKEKVELVYELCDLITALGMEPIAVVLGTPLHGLDFCSLFSTISKRRFPHAALVPLTSDSGKPISRHGITADHARKLCDLIREHIMTTACTEACLHERQT